MSSPSHTPRRATRKNCGSAPAPAPARRRLRAFRTMDQEQMVQEHRARLGCFLSAPQDIARALRDSRKAAMGLRTHYDPARHAALVRLARESLSSPQSRPRPAPSRAGEAACDAGQGPALFRLR